jgi:hypothetical protein
MLNINKIDGIDKLRERIRNAESVEDWSFILSDYISKGNTKITNTTAIFNMNSAHDCPNRESENCQVPWKACYAGKAERVYKQTLPYRRRQEYLWYSMKPELWAKAFECLNSRKRKPFDSIRFSEAGDFRSDYDIKAVDTIAENVSVDVYTYSASDYLNWELAENFTVNASNPWFGEFADRRYIAVGDGETMVDEKPENAVWCPNSVQQKEGVPAEERIKCGECRLCINPEGPDVAIDAH